MDYPRAMAAAHVVGERLGERSGWRARWPPLTGSGTCTRCSASRADASDDEIKRGLLGSPPGAASRHEPGRPRSPRRGSSRSTVADEVLRDPERRARYDRFGPEGVFGSQAGAGGFGFDGGLGDIFEAFFGQMAGGGGGRRRAPDRCGRRGAARPRIRRGGLRLPEGDLGPPTRDVRDVRGSRHGARNRSRDVRRTARGVASCAGCASRCSARWSPAPPCTALQRHRRDDHQPLRRLPRRGPPHGFL